jgi:hypothetical protein
MVIYTSFNLVDRVEVAVGINKVYRKLKDPDAVLKPMNQRLLMRILVIANIVSIALLLIDLVSCIVYDK